MSLKVAWKQIVLKKTLKMFKEDEAAFKYNLFEFDGLLTWRSWKVFWRYVIVILLRKWKILSKSRNLERDYWFFIAEKKFEHDTVPVVAPTVLYGKVISSMMFTQTWIMFVCLVIILFLSFLKQQVNHSSLVSYTFRIVQFKCLIKQKSWDDLGVNVLVCKNTCT